MKRPQYTRKTYSLIAGAICEAVQESAFEPRSNLTAKLIALAIAERFIKDNPRFDTDIFLRACDLID